MAVLSLKVELFELNINYNFENPQCISLILSNNMLFLHFNKIVIFILLLICHTAVELNKNNVTKLNGTLPSCGGTVLSSLISIINGNQWI